MYTEVISALNRLRREDKINTEQYNAIKTEFLNDINEFEIMEIIPNVISVSISCLEKGTIRTLDALHIGCALASGCSLFLTSDKRQYGIAKQMKLNTELI